MSEHINTVQKETMYFKNYYNFTSKFQRNLLVKLELTGKTVLGSLCRQVIDLHHFRLSWLPMLSYLTAHV